MTGYPWTAWLWWIGGATIGLLGLWLLYWSLLHDRSRGRRRCPKCWYNMSGTDSLTCSECGRTVKREKRLYKTRRRWRWVFVSIGLFLAGHVAHTAPRIQKAGWIGTVPTTVLITGFPWRHKMRLITTLAYQPGWAEAITNELGRRIKANETWRWQNHKLAWMHFDQTMNHQGMDSESASQIYNIYRVIGKDVSVLHPRLFTLLKSGDTEIVRSAGYLLSEHPTDDPAILNTIEALFQHKDETVRELAPYLLVKCTKNNPDYAIPKLIAAMHDPSPNVCASAISAVWRIEPAAFELIPTLEEFLTHENEQVRTMASWVLDYLNAAKKRPVQNTPGSSK